MDKTKQERFLEMFQNFLKLSSDQQTFVGGVVQGMNLQKQNSDQFSEISG
ncbi:MULTISPECIES: hypothetical protein [Clostridium]|nr:MULTISPECIES: hypothetical protein [Clostridium]EHN16997.1 hypothetical protein IYC_00812 [Clostridium sporogenes PA 3679]